MKKSISKVLMLIFAVVLVAGSLGTTMAFAADTATLVLDSGAISIMAAEPNAAGVAQATVKQGSTSTTVTSGVNGIIINVKQLNPAISTANSITIGANVNVNLKFLSAVNIAPATGAALSIGAGSNVNLPANPSTTLSSVAGGGGTLNASGGTLTVNNGITGCALNVSGATLTVNGGVSSVLKNVAPAINVSSGKLNINSGVVNVPVTVNGGALELSGGDISGAVTVNNGTLTQRSGSMRGAVTLNNGNLTIAGGLPPSNLTVTGGTYTINGSSSYKYTITLPYSNNYTGNVTYTYNSVTSTVLATNGVFNAYLPISSGKQLTTKVNGIDYSANLTVTAAGGSATANAKAILQLPADITNHHTGTRFDDLSLPSKLKAKLGSSEIDVDVRWSNANYSTYSTSWQEINSASLTSPANIILDPSSAKVKVKLIYRSSGGGNSNSNESHVDTEYEFWRGVLTDVEGADKGDTIHAYAGSFSNMPATILEALKGKNVTLEIARSSGSDILIYGKNIRSLEKGRVTYSMAQLVTLFKDGKKPATDTDDSSSSKPKIPTTAPSTAPSTYVPPQTSYSPPAATVTSSSSSSSSEDESSAASPDEDETSSEEEIEPSEPEVIPTEQPIVVKPKKNLSPLSVAIIITVVAAILSGIVACIILQRRSKHDQF